jgi:hypothetical protein
MSLYITELKYFKSKKYKHSIQFLVLKSGVAELDNVAAPVPEGKLMRFQF